MAAGILYKFSAPAAGFTFTAAGGDADLLQIKPASGYPVQLLEFTVSQKSEVAEAQEEMLIITLRRMTATVTDCNGTSVTAKPLASTRMPSAQCSGLYNGATVATTTGSNDIIGIWAWNERATPFTVQLYNPMEGEIGPLIRSGETLCIRVESTAADDLTATIDAVVREF